MEALAVRRVSTSADLANPGEYVFIEKRQPRRNVEQIPIEPPSGFFRRLWWEWFGKKYTLRVVLEMLWPEIDTIILNCPVCNGPCATTKNHKIISVEPLTLEIPLTCPYCKTNTFVVREGQIMTA
jgi:uncharacterized protein YbaR (Trm112 family)